MYYHPRKEGKKRGTGSMKKGKSKGTRGIKEEVSEEIAGVILGEEGDKVREKAGKIRTRGIKGEFRQGKRAVREIINHQNVP